jgi:hypothetical protein
MVQCILNHGKEATATSKNGCDKHKAEDDANIDGISVVMPDKDDSEKTKK